VKMNTNKKSSQEILDAWAALFSRAGLENMKLEGRAIIEAGREGVHVTDAEGRGYIDGDSAAGIFNLGRRNTLLVEELKCAMRETDQGNFPMISVEKARLAQALSEFVGGELDCSIYSVMRGETLEFACKVARGFTGRSELVTVDGAYYGETGFAMSLSADPQNDKYGPLIPDVRLIPFGDIEAARESITTKSAAVILEPIQAENHCRCAADAYLIELRKICHEKGVLLVFDETQSGLGRCGEKFSYLRSGIEPDMLIMGEALGGGIFPIAATIITQRVNEFLNIHPMIHLSTFGGSDIGCRVAKKALDIYKELEPWHNARRIGLKLRNGIEAVIAAHPQTILSIAGEGLLMSLEFDGVEAAQAFCRRASANGLLLSRGRIRRETVMLRPPLILTDADAGEILRIIGESLA